MFDSRSLDTRSFDARSFNFGVEVVVEQQPSGNYGYSVYLRQYDRQTPEQIHAERVKLGIFTEAEIKEAETLVAAVIEDRTEKSIKRDTEAELRAAEARFREWLAAVEKEWTREFILLLAASYAKIEQENVDAQIVLLLWEM